MRMLVALILAMTAAVPAATHDLKLTLANAHWGYYDARVKPVLRIGSGDTLRVEMMVAGGLERLKAAGVPDSEIPKALKQVETSVTERSAGVHPLIEPIYVEGAEPRDVLEIYILGFEFLHPYGISGFMPNRGGLPDEFPYSRFKKIPVDVKAGTAKFRPGMTMKLLVSHRISSGPPGWHGGNLDNKELVAGSVLYLPVQAQGALLSMGDGHALQRDGDVTLTALETSLRGSIEIFVRKGKPIRWPRAKTPTHFIAMA